MTIEKNFQIYIARNIRPVGWYHRSWGNTWKRLTPNCHHYNVIDVDRWCLHWVTFSLIERGDKRAYAFVLDIGVRLLSIYPCVSFGVSDGNIQLEEMKSSRGFRFLKPWGEPRFPPGSLFNCAGRAVGGTFTGKKISWTSLLKSNSSLCLFLFLFSFFSQ